MREIIFRGKRVDNGEWVEGLLWKKKYNHNKIFISYFPDEDDYEDTVVVDPETVGQYTGLKDKNGKRIFEGDVIKDSYGLLWLVVFENNAFAVKNRLMELCFALWEQWVYDWDSKEWISPSDRFEVIGNIHDNPELLGGDKE